MSCKHEPLYSIDPCPAMPEGSMVRVGLFGPAYVCRICGVCYVTAEEIARVQKDAKREPGRGVRTRIPIDDGLQEDARMEMSAEACVTAKRLTGPQRRLLEELEDPDQGCDDANPDTKELVKMKCIDDQGWITPFGGDVLDEILAGRAGRALEQGETSTAVGLGAPQSEAPAQEHGSPPLSVDCPCRPCIARRLQDFRV